MEDEDGTCLLDVLCDPQALNHFLHGTNELQTEDLLISASSGETSLFTDAPSPVSLLGGGQGSPDTPPPGCVDLSFLEEALLSSPEGGAEPPGAPSPGPAPPDLGCPPKKAEEEAAEEEEEEEEESCDILQQSLQEADITEQTMALEAGLTLYSPAPPLSVLPPPFVPKAAVPPRDTQAVVEPPQPSLLAVGPGCPSLKPASPQVMGLLPGNVFPAPPPDASFSLSPVQGSGMILHKAAPSVSGRALVAPPPGLLLHRAPLPIQPKLPISIQPRLVQISPKPSGPKPTPGLTFVQGTASPNILLSPPAGPKPAGPKPVAPPALSALAPPKPVSLQLVNQGGSFLLQPHGLFQGQNPFLVPGQAPVTISQPPGAAGPLLTPARAGPLLTPAPPAPTVHSVTPPCGQLVDSSQILAVPQRQLKFGPVFAPGGPLALPQATLLSAPLQLHSAPPAVFQMPAQLAGTFAAGGRQATLVQGPAALGNHITLINSSGVLPSDLASISIVNRPPLVGGGPLAVPFAAAAAAPAAEGQLSLQGASVVLLPEEKSGTDETFQLSQRLGPVLQQVSVLPAPPPPPPPPAGPQSSSPPVVTVLQPPPEPAVVPDLTGETPKQAMLPADVEEVTRSLSQNQAFMKHLHEVQSSPTPPIPTELLVGSLPLVPMEPLASPAGSEAESGAALAANGSLSREDSPLLPDSQDAAALGSPSLAAPAAAQSPDLLQEPGARFPGPSRAPPPDPPAPHPQVHESPSPLSTQQDSSALSPSAEARDSVGHAVRQHRQSQPSVAPLPSPAVLSVPPPEDTGPAPQSQQQMPPKKQAAPEEQQEEELTPACRHHRFQQQLCSDHASVQNPITGQPFSTLKDAVRQLLPYHAVAGAPPAQLDFSKVDQEFQSVSGFLLKRTKDMMNKYRQLLVRETQQESPSAEMVMLERLFLQAERNSLAEDQRRARRDPESFVITLATSASSPQGAASSRSPASPPAWTRPPGLKTYCSSSRGALRLTIKQESGSRKVVHNSACEQGLKRDHTGQLANGGGGGVNGPAHNSRPGEELSNGAPPPKDAPCPKAKAHTVAPPLDGAAPKPKCYRLEASERRISTPPPPPLPQPPPPPPPLQDDNTLSQHLQSAIDSILELQRLQGPAPPGRGMPGHAPSLDTPITSILKG